MRVLVSGGRGYSNRKLVFEILDEFHSETGIDLLIHGAAPGADSLAEEWAKKRQVAYLGVPAKWDAFGKAAGPKRNRMMVEKAHPEHAFVFPGGKGTADMTSVLEENKVPYRKIRS